MSNICDLDRNLIDAIDLIVVEVQNRRLNSEGRLLDALSVQSGFVLHCVCHDNRALVNSESWVL